MREIGESTLPESRSSWPVMQFAKSGAALSLDRGFYFPQLLNYVQLFGWKHVKVINYVQFARAPEQTMNSLFRWMKLKPLDGFETLKICTGYMVDDEQRDEGRGPGGSCREGARHRSSSWGQVCSTTRGAGAAPRVGRRRALTGCP